MGLANWLTTLRILLIPVFVTLLVYRRPGWAFLVFCAASLTDMLDGYIARRRGTQTRLGAFLDPVADKLLMTSAFVTLTYLKVIPFWIAAVVVSRDLILSVGVLVIHVAGGTVHPSPSWLGSRVPQRSSGFATRFETSANSLQVAGGVVWPRSKRPASRRSSSL